MNFKLREAGSGPGPPEKSPAELTRTSDPQSSELIINVVSATQFVLNHSNRKLRVEWLASQGHRENPIVSSPGSDYLLFLDDQPVTSSSGH